MKLKRPICLLCIILSICLLLYGCGTTNETSAQGESDTTQKQEDNTSEIIDNPDPKPANQTLSSTESGEFANMMFRLTSDNFLDFFHYRIESADQGGEYDVLSYAVEINASADGISPYVEGISADISFDVKIKYAKEYTESGLLYDTLDYTFRVSGQETELRGTADLTQIPVFKRNDTDTDHKKFTVLSVTPHIDSTAGVISYSSVSHTYKEAVTYDTIPGFEIVTNDDCIAVYMKPENGSYLYDDLAVDIELLYTSDTSGKPDQYIRYLGGQFTIEGNLGGYGQLLYPLESIEGGVSKVVVSVVGVSGSVVRPKGYTVYERAN